jgi:hypothetical protein
MPAISPRKRPGVIVVARVVFELMAFLVILKARGFGVMRTRVAACPVARDRADEDWIGALTLIVDRACMYSPWSTRCLARAAILTRVLRSHGFPATMVTMVQRLPFDAHACVELNGQLVYGFTDRHAGYLEIDRV